MYDKLSIFSMFHEAEILAMDDSFILSLNELLDDKMTIRLNTFIDNFISSNIPAEDDIISKTLTQRVLNIATKTQDKRRRMTLHLEAKERELSYIFRYLNLEAIILNEDIDKRQLLVDLNWLFANSEFWTSEIRPRSKEAYELFLHETDKLMNQAWTYKTYYRAEFDVNLRSNERLLEYIKENKSLFYNPQEKPRPTGFARLIRERTELDKIHHYLIYNRECDALQMDMASRLL